MFGILVPLFLFISFAIGRDLPPDVLVPGLMAISVFFAASSIGPMAVPTERKTKTYERMITAPVSPLSILLGEIAGGAIFGAIIAAVPLVIGILFYGTLIANPLGLMGVLVLISFAFSAMGIMFAAIPTDNPGDVMMILNFVRLPLLFVSGIFIPVSAMGMYSAVALASPLTYAKDFIQYALTGAGYYGPLIDSLGIAIFTGIFLWVGVRLHERNRRSG
jgi:ABC-2 type transport system permease protein